MSDDTVTIRMIGGPFHDQRMQFSSPPLWYFRVRLPDPHNPYVLPLIPQKPNCLEQREIEALTGHSYRREPRILQEDFERDDVLTREYRLKHYRSGQRLICCYVFDDITDAQAADFLRGIPLKKPGSKNPL